MSAGESAYDVARRQREKAERLQRSAALWEQGAEGEVAVAQTLAALPEGWVVLHDLAWPGRQRANLDHVVVGPGGVFVVDAKNWTGRIEVRDQVLRQNGRAREQIVASAAEAALALQRIVPPPAYCMAVLCFVRAEPITGWARDVMVCSTSNLVAMLASRPTVLEPTDVAESVAAILAGADRDTVPRRSRAVATSRATGRRTTKKRGRPAVAFAGALALLAAIWSGGYQAAAKWAGDWAGERFVDVMAPDSPTQPTPSQPQQQQREKQKAKKDQQRAG